ncbi:MAG: DUF1581 domain-containing protein, partial [Planctomycetaceae bacterium]|nr:DUF1581 domain-containing protein [Planctomycetaceae bacterium]
MADDSIVLRCRWLSTFLWLFGVVPFGVTTSFLRADDQAARSVIFAEQHVTDSVLSIHERMRKLPAELRYEQLIAWVLPGPKHEGFRLQVDFGVTQPAPPADEHPLPAGQRVANGGMVVSPALDLVDAAVQCDRLEDLRHRVEQIDRQSPQRAAMLTLIHLARKDSEAALAALEQCLEVAVISVSDAPADWEWLLAVRGRQCPELHERLANLLGAHLSWLLPEFARSMPRQHLAAILLDLQQQQAEAGGATSLDSATSMNQWDAVSRMTAATRGRGEPNPWWLWKPGSVSSMASHNEDYLYFNTPLRGDYEVECDVSGFNGRDGHLMVAGRWVSALSNHTDFDIGTFAGRTTRFPLDPPLTITREWNHYRTVVRNGTVTTWFNGRLLHQEQITSDSDPWLAIRSN